MSARDLRSSGAVLAGWAILAAAALVAAPLAAQELKQADLSITKTSGSDPLVAGSGVTYTVTVANEGPDTTDARVLDEFPPELLACSAQCSEEDRSSCNRTPSGLSGLDEIVSLSTGASVIYTVDCTLDESVRGSLVNTATVEALGGVVDPSGANNTATDMAPITASSDLAIAFASGGGTAVAGEPISYTLTVTNAGPSDAFGATVMDSLPADLMGCSWTCSGNGGSSCAAAAGSGDVLVTLDLPLGTAAEVGVACTVDSGAIGQITNTATVERPQGTSDLDLANNTAVRIDGVAQSSDLSITKSDGAQSSPPGGSVTYTLVVANAGPSDVSGATVTDTFASPFEMPSWSCTPGPGAACTAGPVVGNLVDTVAIPAGGSVTYLASAGIDLEATGSLANTATVVAPAGVDPELGNNSSTDTNTLVPTADLEVTKENGVEALEREGPVTYTVTVTNLGPGDVTGATVTDVLPSELLSATWTCFAASGASCTEGPVSGNVDDLVDLAVGSSVTYTIEATVAEESTGTILNTASAAVPDGLLDPVPENDSASDEDTVERADLALTKRALSPLAVSGGSVGWEIVVTNAGPDDAMGARVLDLVPESVVETTWVCSSAGEASCVESGGGELSESVDLPMGGSVTFTLRSLVDEEFAGILQNTARVLPPAGLPDPVPGNNADEAVLTVKVPIFFDEFESGDTTKWSGSVGETGLVPGLEVIEIETVKTEADR